jgi:hypothetical protein
MNRGPFGLLGLVAFFATRAIEVIIDSGPKGWIVIGVAVVGVSAAHVQDHFRTRR